MFLVLIRQLLPTFIQCMEQASKSLIGLQAAQILRVGTGNIHRHIVGKRVDRIQAGQVIIGRAFNGCAGVFSNIQAQQHGHLGGVSKPRLLHVG